MVHTLSPEYNMSTMWLIFPYFLCKTVLNLNKRNGIEVRIADHAWPRLKLVYDSHLDKGHVWKDFVKHSNMILDDPMRSMGHQT